MPATGITRSYRILTDLLATPTAPFAEHFVLDRIERFCARHKNVTTKRDAVGNLLVRVKQGRRTIVRPVCITAHLDHPGFVVEKMIGKTRARAFWRGGVPAEYFVGSKVRFYVAGRWVKGTVKAIKKAIKLGRERVDTATFDVKGDLPPGTIGMWDFPDPVIRGGRIYARACDDLAGAAAMLSAIDVLSKNRHACDGYFLFTRAEEVGFVGAIAACKLKTIPKKCFVVAMETSSELPHAQMGGGPILRVGDRASAFTPQVTAHCHAVARALALEDSSFQYQRKLMDGGTCESSAYCTLGYEATGLCVALGNYHNVDAKRKKLGPEYIDLSDYYNAMKWFVELVRAPRPYRGKDDVLIKQIVDLEKTYRSLLKRSVRQPC